MTSNPRVDSLSNQPHASHLKPLGNTQIKIGTLPTQLLLSAIQSFQSYYPMKLGLSTAEHENNTFQPGILHQKFKATGISLKTKRISTRRTFLFGLRLLENNIVIISIFYGKI
jgi:hypothetical protein